MASYKKINEEERLAALSFTKKRKAAEKELRLAEQKLKRLEKQRAKSVYTDIENIEIVKRDKSQTVIVEMSHALTPSVKKLANNKYLMSFVGAKIQRSLQKTLDARKLKGPIQTISTYTPSGNGNTVNVVVNTKDGIEPKLERSGKRYYWNFSDGTKNQKAHKRKKLAAIATSKFKSPQVAGYSVTASPISQQTVSQLSKRRKSYSGKRIDLNYKDASIHDLMRLLAEVGAVSYTHLTLPTTPYV